MRTFDHKLDFAEREVCEGMAPYNDAIHRNPSSGLDENDVARSDFIRLDISP